MQHPSSARIAVAGPVALVAALICMAAAAALSNLAQWSLYVVIAVLPAALCLWLSRGIGASTRALVVIAAPVVSLGTAAAVLYLLVPFFEVPDVGISGTGVHTLLWGPTIVVLLGSLFARGRSSAPLLGAWLLWWVAAVSGIIWAEPLTYALTDMAGADGMAGTIAVLVAPTVGMAAWVGAVSAVLAYARYARGHLTGVATPPR